MYDGALVRLRAMEPEDAEAQHRWFNDLEVVRYLMPRYPIGLPGRREWIAERAPISQAAARFSVERLDTGQLIGFAALRDVAPENLDAELDLVVGERSAWGHGFGADTTRTLCRFGFDEMNLHRIHLYVFVDNAPAVHIYQQLGFVSEGTVRESFYRRGRYHDAYLMGLLRAELR